MKALQQLGLVLLLTMSYTIMAQQGINYKALIKDNGGNVVANQNISVQFKILHGGGMTNVYQETHAPTTDANGIVFVNIGKGAVDSGVFVDIDWASDEHHLNVQVDTGGGLVDMGTTQFMSVPYALYAKTAESIIPANLDLIIGKWKFDKTVYLLDNQIVQTDAPTFCDTLTSYEFLEDYTIILISYIGDTSCEFEVSNYEYYNWLKVSEDEYHLISKHPDEAEYVNVKIVIFERNSVMFWPDYFESMTIDGNAFDERRSYFVKY